MKRIYQLVPVEYAELLRQAKTTGEIVFVCRVLLRKKLASSEVIKVVCSLYNIDYSEWERKGFVDLGVCKTIPF